MRTVKDQSYEPRREKRLIGISVESILQCACPAPYQGHVSSSSAEVCRWPTAYMSNSIDSGETVQARLTLYFRICYKALFTGRSLCITRKHTMQVLIRSPY